MLFRSVKSNYNFLIQVIFHAAKLNKKNIAFTKCTSFTYFPTPIYYTKLSLLRESPCLLRDPLCNLKNPKTPYSPQIPSKPKYHTKKIIAPKNPLKNHQRLIFRRLGSRIPQLDSYFRRLGFKIPQLGSHFRQLGSFLTPSGFTFIPSSSVFVASGL